VDHKRVPLQRRATARQDDPRCRPTVAVPPVEAHWPPAQGPPAAARPRRWPPRGRERRTISPRGGATGSERPRAAGASRVTGDGSRGRGHPPGAWGRAGPGLGRVACAAAWPRRLVSPPWTAPAPGGGSGGAGPLGADNSPPAGGRARQGGPHTPAPGLARRRAPPHAGRAPGGAEAASLPAARHRFHRAIGRLGAGAAGGATPSDAPMRPHNPAPGTLQHPGEAARCPAGPRRVVLFQAARSPSRGHYTLPLPLHPEESGGIASMT